MDRCVVTPAQGCGKVYVRRFFCFSHGQSLGSEWTWVPERVPGCGVRVRGGEEGQEGDRVQREVKIVAF